MKTPHPKTNRHLLRASLALGLLLNAGALAQTNAFTYQGRLVDGTTAPTGAYDLRFLLYDTATGGSPIDTANERLGTPVTNGLFAVTLGFGATAFDGNPRWLEIGVRTNGSTAPYLDLAPRQQLTAVPYAIHASTAGGVSGAIPDIQLSTNIARLTANQAFTGLNGMGGPSGPPFAVGSSNLVANLNAQFLNGRSPTDFVAKAGDTMAGGLGLPQDGLAVGGNQIIAWGGKVGIGKYPEVPGNPLLDVNGPIRATPHLILPSGTNYEWWVGGYTDMSYWQLTRRNADDSQRIIPLTVDTGGNVGIGTTNPEATLDVNGTVKAAMFLGDGSGLSGLAPASGSPNYVAKAGDAMSGSLTLPADGLAVGQSQLIAAGGNVGIGKAPTGESRLDVHGAIRASAHFQLPADPGAEWWVGSFTATDTLWQLTHVPAGGKDWRVAITVDASGRVGLGNNFAPQADLDVAGTTRTKVLSITGGADVAEPFAMSDANVPKGAVVVIDDAHPGQLKLGDRAYDRRVAGVVSGAGGVNPGLTLSQQELVEGGQNVALTGRVYALADAANGPIQPGDLLTTSSVPGHAMKVIDHVQAQGAILGKAMSRLEDGRGLVLVLVTLQ